MRMSRGTAPLLVAVCIVGGCVTPRKSETNPVPGEAGAKTTVARGDGGDPSSGTGPAGGPGAGMDAPVAGGGGGAGGPPPITDCPDGSHYCSGGCVDNKSTQSCGMSCDPCQPIMGGGTSTCDGTMCGGTCPSGMT